MKKTFSKFCATIFLMSLWLFVANSSQAAVHHSQAANDTPDSCYIRELPYNEDFDSSTTLPPCWIGHNSVSIHSNIRYTTPPNSLSLVGGSSATAIAILPPFDRSLININELKVTFMARAGSSTKGTLRLGVLTDPTRPESTFSEVDKIELQSVTEFRGTTFNVKNYTDTGCYLAFAWDSEGAGIFIDSIRIEADASCNPVRNVELLNTTGESANIGWEGSAGNYLVAYSEAGYDDWQYRTTENESILLTGLNPVSAYSFVVKSLCATDTSEGVSLSFYTTCNTYYDFFTLDNDTVNTDGDMLPTTYTRGYSYAQQIYLAEEINNSDIITGMAFQYTGTADMTRKMSLYLGLTQDTVFQNNTAWISDTSLTKVFEGDVTFVAGGKDNWTDIRFTTPFEYDGTSNVVIAIDDNTGTGYMHGALPSYFQTLSGTHERSIYHYDHFVNISPSAPSAAIGTSTYRNAIQFLACSYINCITPQSLTASEIAPNSVEISWVELGSAHEYEFCHRKTGGAWICDQVEYKTNEALYDLDAATGYEVRVRGICSEEDTTDWVSVSFTTECDFDTIPYRQNFDTYTSNQLPACWNALGAGSSNYPSVYQEANSSHYVSAYSSLTMKDSYVGATFAVLPAFESYLPELQISFMAKTTDTTSGTLTVGVMTDPIDSTTFAAVSAIIPAQNDQWAKYTVRFDEYMDGGEYIAFKWENGDGNTFYIDDIMVDTIPSCYAPVSLTLEQIGKTNATLSWTDTEGGSWEIAYGTAGFNLASEGTIIATSSNPHTLTTLESNTHYDFYLRRVCDEGDFSEWTDAVSGKTAQIPASIPYAFDFETSSENRNWTMVNSNRNKWVIDTATNNTFGGSQSLYVSADSGATHSYANYFATSIWAYRDFCFPSGPHEDYMLTFDWKGKGQSNLDYLSVYIGAPAPVTAGSNSAPANAFCLFSKLNLNDAWRSDSISLNGHITSDTCRLYFLWTNDGSNGEQPPAAIDNISIRYSPCLAPTDIVIDSIDTESAKISWDAENGIEWVVRYKSEDDDEYQIDTVMTNSYDFTELTSSTHYLVEIFSICGEKRISAAIDTSFTTDEFIPDPVYYTITATADAGGTITPSGEIRILEGTDTTFHILPNEEYVIQSVLVNEVNVGNVTSYTFRNVQGDSSIRVIFQVGINEVEIENNIILYPNPARNVLTIKTDREFDNYTILNDLGQIIRTENISGNSFLIHVEELRNGIYFILFRGDGVMATKKFIKE